MCHFFFSARQLSLTILQPDVEQAKSFSVSVIADILMSSKYSKFLLDATQYLWDTKVYFN